MLVSRKITKDKRVMTDFRHLNMRIAKNNLAYPLLKDMFTLLGSSKCEVMSVLNLKDAFYSLRLTESSKKYCGILPYFGSASYLYQRMPMGLNISPAVWQSYINAILSCLSSKKYCEAIMDDLLLFTPTKQSHYEKLKDLLKALCKSGLKISPKKCQLFKTELQYMGNTIFIKDKWVCVKSLRSRLEAIQRLKPPATPKGCRSFGEMVNFVSMFCPELQKLLKPIYDLTKKGRHFCGETCNKTHLRKSKADCRNLQFSVYPTEKVDLHYIQTPVNLQLVVGYINSKMENPDLLHTSVNGCLRQPKTIESQN